MDTCVNESSDTKPDLMALETESFKHTGKI